MSNEIDLNAEPTHPSIRVADRDGDVWARYHGRWGCVTVPSQSQMWSDLWHVCGPLTFADNAAATPAPAPCHCPTTAPHDPHYWPTGAVGCVCPGFGTGEA